MLRARALLTVGVLVAGLTGAIAPSDGAVPVATTTITAFLKAPQPEALAELADTRGLSRADRLAALRDLVPSRAVHLGVINALRAQGFRIVGRTAWSITATGPSSAAQALFGARPDLAGSRSSARVRAATGPLPRVPAVLGAAVSAVFPTAGGPAAYHHASTHALAGPDFRNAYTPATVTPSTGQNDAGATIATLQLADFYGIYSGARNSREANDLVAYAKIHHLGNPVADGRYEAIRVDGGPHSNNGDDEVDLDQESILSTAPSAKQRAYFAPNTVAGYNDVFARVYDDVTGRSATPDRHIMALSVSWGQCESLTGARNIATLEPILQALSVAGVTVFAATGDAGIYDCGYGDHNADVDYPASSPHVVAVGGSYLSAPTSAPNRGRNWTESAWSCSGAYGCQGAHGGTGGGASGEGYRPKYYDAFGGFPMPGYQRVTLDKAPFAGGPKRLVPDIAANGAPGSGFRIVYHASPYETPQQFVVGGTSLAAPISAAGLVNALCDKGRKTGVGQIQGALYSAYRATRDLPRTDRRKVFRDITSGLNGNRADRSTNPSVYAQPGYDTVSGLGGVLWPALVPYLLDPRTPAVTSVSFTSPTPHTAAWRKITARWTIARAGDRRMLGATQVSVRRLGRAAPIWQNYVLPASSSRSFTGLPGATYVVTVTGRDLSGRRSAPKSALVRVPVDDAGFRLSRAMWHRVAGRLDVGGSHVNSTTKGATASAVGTGQSYALRVHVGPDSGVLGVYLRGTRVARIDLNAPAQGFRTVRFYDSSTRAKRTFTFINLTGRRVNVDALYVTF